MRISVRFRIYPTPIQRWNFGIALEAQRLIYNAKIEQDRLQEWLQKRAVYSPSWCLQNIDISTDNKIDKTYAKFKSNKDIPLVPSPILRGGIDKYVQAVRNHMHNQKHWRKPRPQRAMKGLLLSRRLFRFRNDQLWVGSSGWQVGQLRMKVHRPHGIPAMIVIRETQAGRWFCSFSWEDDRPDPPTDRTLKKQLKAAGEGAMTGKVLGMDRGIRPVVALSTGEDLGLDDILHGRSVKRLLACRRRLKRKLSRQKDLGSRRRLKTKRQLARNIERQQDIRWDAFRKAVHQLVQGPMEVFVMETLKLKGIRKSLLAKTPAGRMGTQPREMRRRVARAMTRSSLGEFARMLRVAASRAGKLVLGVPPQHSSTTCSVCGHNSPGNRPDRDTFKCTACHQALDPDINAARNLAQLGIRTLFPKPKSPAGPAGAKARGGADRPVRGTASKPGTKTSRNEKPSHRVNPVGQRQATNNPAARAVKHLGTDQPKQPSSRST